LGTNDSAAVWSAGDTTGIGSPSVYPVDNLSYSGLLTSTNSSGLIMGLMGKSRNCAAPISGTTSNIYTSFLLDVLTYPSANSAFAAMSTVTSGSPGSSANAIWISPSGQLLLTLDSTSGTTSAGTTPLTTNVTHFVVTSYTNKTFYLWLDPSPSTFGVAESKVPTSNISTNYSDGKADTAMQTFWIIHDSSKFTNFIAELDEIRVGSTWASVTPVGPASAATAISFTTQPGYAGVGASIGTVVAQIVDQYGNPFTNSGVPITLSLSGSGSLGGTVTQNTDGTGKATFTGISVSAPGVDQLVANGGGLPAGTSDYFSVFSTSGGGGSVPKISKALDSPGGFVLMGSNGQANQTFSVLATSSLATPRSSWTPVGSSSFDGSGNFNCTNPVSGSQRYYALSYTSSGGGTLTLPNFVSTGFASTNNVTGGKGGPTATVTNYSDFTNYLNYPAPVIIRVAGTLVDPYAGAVSNDYAYINHSWGADDKTIIGVGTNATLVGVDLCPQATNIIIRNLFFQDLPGGTNDCITLDGGTDGTNGYTWIDHCDFYDAQDGSCDITKGADYVTLSWCHFHYQSIGNPKPFHRLADLIGASDSDTNVNFHVTFHHDWYDTNCMERMPSVRAGHVHVFNNYYACPGNDYCVRTRIYAQVFVESTYFNGVNNPFEYFIDSDEPVHGTLLQTNNIAVNCTTNYNYILLDDTNHLDLTGTPPQAPNTFISSNAVSISYWPNETTGSYYSIITNNLTATGLGNDILTSSDFHPLPYTYTPDPVANVPNIVTNYSGAGVILPLP
jgi:pectate lyase